MALKAQDLQVGETYEQVVVEDLKRVQLVMYAGVSGDYNPIHTDEIYATQVAGYRSIFAHGSLTMGLTSRAVTDIVGDGRLVRFGGRYNAQVWPGDTLTTRSVVATVHLDPDPMVELEVITVNQENVPVFTGYAVARIDL